LRRWRDRGTEQNSQREYSPLYMTGLTWKALSGTNSPVYPVSSLSSRMAQASGVSFGSMRPAGTSIHVELIGGRHCFWRTIRGSSLGFAGSRRMAATPTPSMSAPWGRVRRSPDSHVRSTPSGSVYVILRQSAIGCQVPTRGRSQAGLGAFAIPKGPLRTCGALPTSRPCCPMTS
jgi:hypothetical protein